MEKFININSLVNNDINNAFKDLAICPLCSNILIEPYMCMKCQKVYCKKCIDEWKNKDDKCPNKCENPNYEKSLEKNNILCKLKFKCQKCDNEFLYEELIKHVDTCSGKKNNNKITPTNRMKKLSKEQAEKIQKKGKESINITCKNNIIIYYINIVITLGLTGAGKSSLIYT